MVLSIVFFLNLCVFQQQKITVVDEKTKGPLELVHLIFYKNGKVYKKNATNKKGVFIVNFEYDSLKTSVLGYNPKTVVNDAANELIIKLSENVLKIDEVVLMNSKKTTIIGDWNIKGKKKTEVFTPRKFIQ